jgi:outer membrane lipoprotein-sorting protein
MNFKQAFAVVVCLAVAVPAFAQADMTDIVEKVSAARQANAQNARNYSWTQRTEVKLKGETKSLKAEIVRYTVDGELQKTPIDETSAKKPRGVRGKVAKKKAGEMKDWMADLGELLKNYSLPTAGNLLDFLNKAAVSQDGDGRRLDATDVVQAGDRMSVWIDANHKMTKTEVSTQHDGSDVKLETDHATTPDGLDYTARTVIVVPDKGVEMTVENFSYQRER